MYSPLTGSIDESSSGSLTEVFLLPERRLGEEPGVSPCITSAEFLRTASRAARKPLAGSEHNKDYYYKVFHII